MTVTPNGYTLDSVKNGTASLVLGTDYIVSDNTVILSKDYLAQQATGKLNLNFDFSGGNDSTLTITIIDSSVVVAGNLRVQMFNGNTASSTNGIAPKIKLYNTGTTDINLSDCKLRYYYTIDGEKDQSFWCDWSSTGSGNVTGTFVKMNTVKEGADNYLEIGFTTAAGTLAAGQSIEIQARFSKADWTNYTQTGDYSFDGTSTNYVDATKVTAYVLGSLVWGIEP
nr:cellulose binding domain-containing protein [Anaeromicropila herbilytica]